MSILHTVCKSPNRDMTMASCLDHVNAGDAVLLFEDGVYGAVAGTAAASDIAKCAADVYVLGGDLAARGIAEDKLAEGVKVVGYDGFVDLATEHSAVNSWL